jgi:hypothetical protein
VAGERVPGGSPRRDLPGLLAAAGDDAGSQNALTAAQKTMNGFAASLSEERRRAFLASPSVAALTG